MLIERFDATFVGVMADLDDRRISAHSSEG